MSGAVKEDLDIYFGLFGKFVKNGRNPPFKGGSCNTALTDPFIRKEFNKRRLIKTAFELIIEKTRPIIYVHFDVSLQVYLCKFLCPFSLHSGNLASF